MKNSTSQHLEVEYLEAEYKQKASNDSKLSVQTYLHKGRNKAKLEISLV